MAKATVGRLEKQSYEEFRIDADFGNNMVEGEVLVLGDSSSCCEVKIWDKDGTETTSEMLDESTIAIITGSESGITDAGLQILVKGGAETKSKYKITFYGVTDLTPPNRWEKDCQLTIRELP